MNRQVLHNSLEAVAPALATTNVIPVFQCFLFDRGGVLAYDDITALWMPVEGCSVQGAIRGKALLDWASLVRSKEVSVESTKKSVVFAAGRSRLELPILPAKDFPFEIDSPNEPPLTIKLDADGKLLSLLAQAAVCMGESMEWPSFIGLTLKGESGRLTVWSTDNKSACRISSKWKGMDCTFTLPPRFVQLLLSSRKLDIATKLLIGDGWVEANFISGKRLWSKTIADANPNEYQSLFSSVPSTKEKDIYIPVPSSLENSLKRAEAVLPYCTPPYSTLTIKAGKMSIITSGEIKGHDRIQVEKHKEIEVMFSPGLVLRALPYAELISIQENEIILAGRKSVQLISTVQKD